MNKTAALTFAALLVGAATASAAVTVDYYNKDSKDYSFEALCSGSKYTLELRSSTTGASTMQGSGPCKVKHAGGEISLSGGEKIEIKDGKITLR